MPAVPLPRAWQPNDIIPAQWANNVGLNDQTFDVRTGGDPGSAGLVLASASGTAGIWRALQSSDFGSGIIPSSALAERKVDTLSKSYLTMAAAAAGGSHFFDTGATPDGPNANGFMGIQVRHPNYTVDYRWQMVAAHGSITELYVQGVANGVISPWYKVFHSGNTTGAGSGLNADTLRGYVPGNASGQIPINNGSVNANLNASYLDGQPKSYYAPIGIVVIWPAAIAAAPVGWVHETNLDGRFPVGVSPTLTIGAKGGVDRHAHRLDHNHSFNHWHSIDHDHGVSITSESTTAGGTVAGGGSSSADPQHHVHYFDVPAFGGSTPNPDHSNTDTTLANSQEYIGLPPYWAIYYIRRAS